MQCTARLARPACAPQRPSQAAGKRIASLLASRATPARHAPLAAHASSSAAASAADVAASDAAAAPACDPSVSRKYCGLAPAELKQAFRAEHPGLLEALASATAHMTPATAAPLLRRLEAELPPTLTDVAPSGDCVLVAIEPGLVPLLEHAVECCEASLRAGSLGTAAATARAVVSLLSRLTFGGAASVAPYAAAGTRCKQALKAAYDAGAEVRQEDAVELYRSCARASPWLWLTPYAGLRFAAAVDDAVTAGWHTGELAVRFTEAYAQLVGSGRYAQVPDKFVRLVRAALQHPLSVAQVWRLLDATHRLPVEMMILMDLHARSEPVDCWYAALQQRLRVEQKAAAAVANAAVAAPRGRSFALHRAARRAAGSAQP